MNTSPTNYKLIILVFLLLASNLLAQNSQPNVLWILTDDQRYDAIRSFNQILHDREMSDLGYVESPHIDELAAMGTTFINTYCQAQGCAPSRASMHYGRYPFRSGVYEFEYHNNNAEHCRPTLPEQMANRGYQTLHIGKLGVRLRTGEEGNMKNAEIYQTDINSKFLAKEGLCEWGKDWIYELNGIKLEKALRSTEFFITPAGKIEYCSLELEEIMPEYKGVTASTIEKYELLRHYNQAKGRSIEKGMIISGVSPRPAGETRDGYYASVFTDYLRSADQEFKVGSKSFNGVNSSQPLFCHIGFDFPHTPVLPPADYRTHFQEHHYKVPGLAEGELETMPVQLRKQVMNGYSDHLSDQEKQAMIQDYYAFCAYGDQLVGEAATAFIEYSENHNQEWLIVFVCGDHGWKLNDHGSVSKFTPWEMDSHNPIIVVSSDKKRFPAGAVIRDFTEFVDIAPTILAAAGANLQDKELDYLDGLDLAGYITGKAPLRDYVIGESHAVTGPRAFIRTEEYVFSIQTRPDKKRGENMDWALKASYEDLDPALYHTTADPTEVQNLAFNKEYEHIALLLRDKLLNIVLGDGRVEVKWGPKADGTDVYRSNFAPGSHDYILDL